MRPTFPHRLSPTCLSATCRALDLRVSQHGNRVAILCLSTASVLRCLSTATVLRSLVGWSLHSRALTVNPGPELTWFLGFGYVYQSRMFLHTASDRGAVFFAHEPFVWFSLGERVSSLLCLAPGGHVIDRARGSIFKQRSSNINQFLHRAWQSQSQYHTRMESILTGHHTYKIPHGAAAFVAAGGPLLTGPI